MSIPNNKYTQSRAQRLGVPQGPVQQADADNGSMALERLQLWYEKNKKTINSFGIGLLIGVAAFFGWRWMNSGKESKAATQMAFAQRYFENDSLNLALNGDGQHPGFLRVISKFGGTESGNLAHYYAGVCYLRTGDFQKAVKHLKDFDAEGSRLGPMSQGALGDAYMELNQLKNAIDAYSGAVANEDDPLATPIYLQRLAMAYEASNKPEDAKKVYIRLRDNHPTSPAAQQVDKALARLGVIE